MNSTQLDLLLQGDHSTERDITAEKSCWEAPGMQRQGLTRPCPRSDDIWSSNRNRKVIWIMGHIRGEQQKMPEGEEKKRGKGKPLLKGLRAMQSRSTAATAGYGPGRPKQATSRRLGNKAGAVKRWWKLDGNCWASSQLQRAVKFLYGEKLTESKWSVKGKSETWSLHEDLTGEQGKEEQERTEDDFFHRTWYRCSGMGMGEGCTGVQLLSSI